MEFLLPLIIGLVIGVVVGGLAVLVIRGRRAVDDGATAARIDELSSSLGDARVELADAQATARSLRELVAQHQAEATERAQREKGDNQVLQALAPVREAMQNMQTKVADLEKQRSQQHGEIAQQLRTAIESDERLRTITSSLASALKSNSTRGVWGEIQLRSVAEAAGMIDHVDFDTQSSITADSGARRPDMVVHLPGGKNIAVDSKVPFNAYLEASAIDANVGGAEGAHRQLLLRDHVKAVRDHINALGAKAYWSGLDASPELTIAFIPSEALISSAVEADPSLIEYAFSKGVALASPVTLWSVLKALAFSWRQAVLTDEAERLFDLTKELYSRLSTTAGHIEKLGRSIESTVKGYNSFVGSLERQVLPSARRIGALRREALVGELSAIDEPVRQLAAPEFVAELAVVEASAATVTASPAEREADAAVGSVDIDALAIELAEAATENVADAAESADDEA